MEDQDSQDEKPNGSSFSGQRCRSSNFSPNEIQTLVNLVAKHKNVVNSKSCNNSALHAKQVAWSRITKMFNSQDFTLNRNMECLKGKWDNLKRVARRLTKNLVDGQNEFDELTTRIVAMICEADNNANNDTAPMDLGDEYNDSNLENQKDLKEDSLKFWDENTEKEDCEKDDSNLETKYRKRINRSINFTPKECRLLLQCVRREKKYVFSKNNSTKFNILKRRAWIRITNNFNKQSEQKRSTSMLLNKLRNMKKLTKKEGVGLPKDNKHSYNNMEDFSHFDSGENQEIKSEPVFNMDEIENDDESEGHEDDITNNNENNFDENSCDDLHSNIERNHINFTPDPLSTILNGDSGLGSLKMDMSESNEITKLKLELLKYQLDNAKLERKRIEDAAQAEAKTNSAREIETALRLRAARLKAVAAALKLAPAHPALLYPPEEIRAQQYLDQYHPT